MVRVKEGIGDVLEETHGLENVVRKPEPHEAACEHQHEDLVARCAVSALERARNGSAVLCLKLVQPIPIYV